MHRVFIALICLALAVSQGGRATGAESADQPDSATKTPEVIPPQKLDRVPRSPVPLSQEHEVWVCGECGWILPTAEMSKENDRLLERGEYRCGRCGSTRMVRMPQARAALQLKALSPNLVPNPSFETGRWWPRHWDPVDRLGTHWARGGTEGRRCIKADTRILESQWKPRNDRILEKVRELRGRAPGPLQQHLPSSPVPEPPEPKYARPPYYSAVGGLHGIHYRSAYIRVRPGAVYRITVDARVASRGGAKVFLKGFVDERKQTEEGPLVLKREIYRAPMTLHGLTNEWRRFSRVFHPARSKGARVRRRLRPEWLQVQLYSYWPVGLYYWDNVRLEVVGYEPVPEQEESTEGSGGEIREKPKGQKDGFPVF